jgi:hypothetical protein
MAIDSVGTRRTPERNSPLIGGSVVINPGAVATITVGSGTTPLTLTAAQILVGLLPVNCTDTGTLTLPTAALLNAAIPGVAVGNWFSFELINFGDSTVTVAVGTGITAKVIDSATAVLTTATNYSNVYHLVCTGVANPTDPSKSDTWDLYGMGTTAAAVA